MAKKIITKGGGSFKITGSRTLEVYEINDIIWTSTTKKIGQANNLADALSIIKAYSGCEIKEIIDY